MLTKLIITMLCKLFLVAILLPFSILCAAQSKIEGSWITFDENTQKIKSHVEIYNSGGVYGARVVELFNLPAGVSNPRCGKCTGTKKDAPIIGMQIVQGMHVQGDKNDKLDGGTILDPEAGKTYKCTIWIDPNDPNRLVVRGYVGFFYKTIYWQRIQKKQYK